MEICGDGLLFTLQCDDGNLQNGDGCSDQCTIETNFTCRAGSSVGPSKCSYNQPLKLSLVSTIKDLESNAITFTISVEPDLKLLKYFNFS